jgi:predicted CXXCH cytochrome family protein
MKHLMIIFFLLLPISMANASSIKGSKHDFSRNVWSQGEVCIACHVPHGANETVPNAPLWGHSITTKVFTPYTNSTIKAAVGQPDGTSKLCLSCHDGTVAIDSFNGTMGSTYMKDPINLAGGGHWRHPVSILYDSNLAVADTRLYNPVTTKTRIGGTISHDLLSYNKVQCTSCHDVHNDSGYDKMLKMNEDNLCKTCHRNQ